MTTEQQIHQALIKANFLKDKDSERCFAWIADCMALGYTDLQIELIGLHSKYFAGNKMIDTDRAATLWGRLTCKVGTEANFRLFRGRAQKTGFKFNKGEKQRGDGGNKPNGRTTLYHPQAIYRLAQHTLK